MDIVDWVDNTVLTERNKNYQNTVFALMLRGWTRVRDGDGSMRYYPKKPIKGFKGLNDDQLRHFLLGLNDLTNL